MAPAPAPAAGHAPRLAASRGEGPLLGAASGSVAGRHDEDDVTDARPRPGFRQAALSCDSSPGQHDALNTMLLRMVKHAVGVPMAWLRQALAGYEWELQELRQAVADLAMTREQQVVLERAVRCNRQFWTLAVDSEIAWNRHVGLNLALLRVYHRHRAATSCVDALSAMETVTLQLSRSEAEEAVRYSSWAAASYCASGALPPNLSVEALIARAAALAGVAPTAIVASQLRDEDQSNDPLCPRFFVAVDKKRNEVVLSVRGTSSVNDLLSDLIGVTVPFAAGVAHHGYVDAARRLQEVAGVSLGEALGQLSVDSSRRLVLTGHSLGAGVAQLLGIILCGGDADSGVDAEGRWCLPSDVGLATFLYAPPPVFRFEGDSDGQEEGTYDGDSKMGTGESKCESQKAKARKAAVRAIESAVGFASNFDIIPRTSLHNGYYLFQQARAVDYNLAWRKRDIVQVLRRAENAEGGLQADAARDSVVSAVSAAIAQAAAGAPAAPNPFPRQHAAVGRMYHLVGAPGATSSFQVPRPEEATMGHGSPEGSLHGFMCTRRLRQRHALLGLTLTAGPQRLRLCIHGSPSSAGRKYQQGLCKQALLLQTV